MSDRICLLVPELAFGGVESCVLDQVRLFGPDRVEVVTFWKAGAVADEIRAVGARVSVLGQRPSIRRPQATLALARWLRRNAPRVVHARIGEAAFHAALASRFVRVPRLVVEEVGIPTRSAWASRAFRGVFRAADVVVGVSRATCAWLEAAGAPPAKVRLVYNAVRQTFLDHPPARGTDGFHVVTAGRLVPVKNHEGLVRVFRRVADALPDARLTIAGDGPLRDALAAQVTAAGLGDRVSLPGFVRDVPALLDTADAFVLPSITEGFGMALVEAMAMGLPAVTSAGSGAAEVLAHDPSRVLDPRDEDAWAAALVALGRMPAADRRALGARHRAVAAERFAPERWKASLEALYG